ncbi:MAG: PilZ domain-containing protein [Planctomycetaceae bacterium]|nr:PilZ domain-containing protein [Planctomycetaceae bacterium]
MFAASSKRPVLTLRIAHRLSELAEIIDASAHDVLLESPVSAQPGQVAELLCEVGFPSEPKTYTGVVHWVQQERTVNRIAVALPHLAPPDVLIKASGSIRESLRFNCSIPVMVSWKNNSLRGRVLNYSRAGFCLTAEGAIPNDQEFTVTWTRNSDQVKMKISAASRWATPGEGLPIAGCNMVKGPLYCFSHVDVDRWLHAAVNRPHIGLPGSPAMAASTLMTTRLFTTYRR